MFQHYSGNSDASQSPLTDRSSSTPETSLSPQDLVRSSFNDEKIENMAVEMFIDEFCVESFDRSLSRGFLDGLNTLITIAGPDSDVSQAAKIVGLANMGIKIGRRSLLDRSKCIHGAVLSSFRDTLSSSTTANTCEALVTAVLLGLYEVRI